MKALTWLGGTDLTWGSVPDPVTADGEVVIDVRLASICGSDLHAYRGSPGPRVPPLILGHEAVGMVDGRRVVPFPLITCGACSACLAGRENLCPKWQLLGIQRPGVFAERFACPAANLFEVPDSLSDERAVLAEPLACVISALQEARLTETTRLAVIGCGPVGLLAIAYGHSQGAAVFAAEPALSRRRLAAQLGAAATFADGGELPAIDVVVDAVGTEATWAMGIRKVMPGGTVLVIGLGRPEGSVPMAEVVRRSVNLHGHFAYARSDFSAALKFLAQQNLQTSWLHRNPMSEGPQSFEALVRSPDRMIKVLLAP